jgi:hypothetical protein
MCRPGARRQQRRQRAAFTLQFRALTSVATPETEEVKAAKVTKWGRPFMYLKDTIVLVSKDNASTFSTHGWNLQNETHCEYCGNLLDQLRSSVLLSYHKADAADGFCRWDAAESDAKLPSRVPKLQVVLLCGCAETPTNHKASPHKT